MAHGLYRVALPRGCTARAIEQARIAAAHGGVQGSVVTPARSERGIR